MKIALFSDIHANLPALQACLHNIEVHQPDAIYCLGDLVGYNVWPNEVINEIRKRGIPTIAGNYDQGIGLHSDLCGCAYKSEEESAMGKISIAFTNSIVGKTERAYLRSLPAHINIQFQLNNHILNVLLVHGSPRKINEYLFEDRDEKSLLRIMQNANADVLCFGHTHKPYHRIVSTIFDNKDRHYHAINIGSVGKPKDDNPQGGFVLLTINDTSNAPDKESIIVEFIRFTYDVEQAAMAIENSPLPNEYASMLRNGR